MSHNQAVKERAAQALEAGGIFAFGLSEQAHGADIYSTDMVLTPRDEGVYTASGRKYYIGNGNQAAIVSTFGKLAGSDHYVFFAADPTHERYECVQNVCAARTTSPSSPERHPLPRQTSRPRPRRGRGPNTVNVGTTWPASIGMHARLLRGNRTPEPPALHARDGHEHVRGCSSTPTRAWWR
jgi:hypothetical protein